MGEGPGGLVGVVLPSAAADRVFAGSRLEVRILAGRMVGWSSARCARNGRSFGSKTAELIGSAEKC